MAALYGRLQGNRGQATRIGHHEIYSKLETWDGSIKTELDRDGNFNVYIGDKSMPGTLVATGNVNHRSAAAHRNGEVITLRSLDYDSVV